MADFIDRQALGIGKCAPKVFENKAYAEGWNSAISIIESAPAADVRPERHGEWIEESNGNAWWYKCSECGKLSMINTKRNLTHFCPNCGSKMDGGIKSE